MKFCDNNIVLSIFIIFKIFVFIIFPIIIIKKKNEIYNKYMIYTEIILIITILLCNIFSINSCIYNSNIKGMTNLKFKKDIINYNELHYSSDNYQNIEEIKANKKYKTYKGKDFYFYNQNNLEIKYNKLPCTDENLYMNKYGSEITSVAMAISTILQRDVSPIDLFELYYEYNSNDCSVGIDISELFQLLTQRYAGINIDEISSSQIIDVIRNEGIVIAEIFPSEKSNLSCGKNYIVIYNTTLENNLIIADPNDSEYDFVCPYSSQAYGNTIKANRTSKEWSIQEINKDVVHYYSIRGV